MKTISFVSNKGGVGKTTNSHAFALGAAWNGEGAHVCFTDNKEPLSISNERPYKYYDARKPETLKNILKKSSNREGILIIDSAANNPEFDNFIAKIANLVIIPTLPDEQNINIAISDLARVRKLNANSYILINKYPANRLQQKAIEKFIKIIPQKDIIGFTADVPILRRLCENDNDENIWGTPPTRINNYARKLYRSLTSKIYDTEMEPLV